MTTNNQFCRFFSSGNMYFPNVHSFITYLEMSRLDGTKRLVLWKTVDEKPRTMAVNPIKK